MLCDGCAVVGMQTCELLTSRKLMNHSIQRAADRALSEQRTLLMAHRQVETELNQWARAATECVPVLRAVVGRINDQLKRAMGEVDAVAGKVSDAFSAWKSCELSRIDMGGAMVCPLDALSRGCLGTEMASFVDTFRLNASDWQALCSFLHAMRKRIVDVVKVDFVKSLGTCIELFSSLRNGDI